MTESLTGYLMMKYQLLRLQSNKTTGTVTSTTVITITHNFIQFIIYLSADKTAYQPITKSATNNSSNKQTNKQQQQ
jgi:hypothetical protein